jgi:hypothetical protein
MEGIQVEAYYANLLAYRVTATELVLEFGSFFGGQENRPKPNFTDYNVRVVMVPDLIEPLINLLEQAKAARDQQRNLFAERDAKEVNSARTE